MSSGILTNRVFSGSCPGSTITLWLMLTLPYFLWLAL
jgi:hypothetical protein